MFNSKNLIALAVALAGTAASQAGTVLDFPMNVDGRTTAASTGSATLAWQGNLAPMQIKGLDGQAWRTDGYTTFFEGQLPQNTINGNRMTAQVCFAIDTNAVIGHDRAEANQEWAKFVDCINGQTGFAFMLGRSGQFAFRTFVGGQEVTLTSDVNSAGGKLQLWQWYNLAGVVDGNTVSLYLDGKLVKSQTVASTGVCVGGTLVLGRDRDHNDAYCGARQADFNGAIDYLRISDQAAAPSFAGAYADLNVPADRYTADRDRALFHGQPGLNWTNETHGLLYNPKDGKYHVIFQRTGSMPTMSHAHYGHIVSSDLIHWEDDKPMIWPSEDYDRRGCWSGCLFTDSQINNGNPTIIYTGVGYGPGESHAAMAYCDDPVSLRSWSKPASNPISNHSNTARDTYFFRTDNDHAYFIIGDEGHMKEWKWNGSGWTENGHFYDFQDGESGFTEMPNVAKLPNGKWLMTFTPWTGSVKCIYRIGDIDSNGRFTNFSSSELFDFYARDGYALMSPSIGADKEGNLIALGIVADKMPTEWNLNKGYAHLYSLPRQLGVDAQGRLTQKPFKGHEAMRGTVSYKTTSAQTLDGALSLNPVRGRQAEVTAIFKTGDARFGLKFLQNAKGKGATLTYNPSTHALDIDLTAVVGGDYGFKTGSYTLPVHPAKGEDFKLQLFIDHSIIDIFVNDRYASSLRVFTPSMEHDLIQVFSEGPTELKSVEAYLLGEGDMRSEPIAPKEFKLPENNGRVAFLKTNSPSAQELAAESFLTSKKLGKVVGANNACDIVTDDYDALWIHIDRPGLAKGAENLPMELLQATDRIKEFLASGGHLYLSGQATQLAVSLNRLASKLSPNEYNSNGGGDGADEWTVNAWLLNGKHDATSHPIFAGLETSDAYGWPTYGMLWGGGSPIFREDHNCMWKLSDFSFSAQGADNYERFQQETHSTVLATWGQERTDGWAGIVEFHPVKQGDSNWGAILANGMAACQWSVANGTNAYAQNLQLLTANTLAYLAPISGEGPQNPGGEYEQPEEPVTPEPEVIESTGKVALYVGYSNEQALRASDSKEEKAALDLFTRAFPGGAVLYAGEESSIATEAFDMVWVQCDRMNLEAGWRNLPEAYRSTTLVNALRDYVSAGGNLLLTKAASQLAEAIGRIDRMPVEWGSGNGDWKTDEWQTNVAHHNGADWSGHPLFSGLETRDCDYGKLVTLMSGSHHREDHNCMLRLGDFGGHDSFCTQQNASVLGTWGHNGGQEFAGIVEFHPASRRNAPMRAADKDVVANRRGTVLTIGLAAYELAPRSGSNDSQANLERLTTNAVGYLSPVTRETATEVTEILPGTASVRWFTLQGVEVGRPTEAGIYIEVRDGKSRKVAVR